MIGIKINEIKTILVEDSFNETGITCQFTLWFDMLIVFLSLRVSSRKHNNNNKNNKKSLNVPIWFAPSER